jgi:hypothetical protein
VRLPVIALVQPRIVGLTNPPSKPRLLIAAMVPAAALAQIAGGVEMSSINMDALLIEQDGIPDSERSGILEPESTEVELTLANAVHQLDA